MTKTIHWEKWKDPFWPDVQRHMRKKEEDFDNPSFRLSEHDDDDDDDDYDPRRRLGPVVLSPLGMIPLRESNIPSKIFNLWVGHTNFGLTRRIQKEIALAPGVEAVNVYTRYRFRLAIGMTFEENTVMNAIDDLFKDDAPRKHKPYEPLQWLKSKLSKRHKFWCILIMPDGTTPVACGVSQQEVVAKMELLGASNAKSIVTSWIS